MTEYDSLNSTDTIAAIATAPGRGGVGIIRISGPKALELGQSISQRKLVPRYAHYGSFIDPASQSAIDEGIALFFPGPHSFTGEDVVELQGHGGPVVLDLILNILIQNGARLANPGEFSERAYLNDKMDLTQAEAIADLIAASSEQAMRNALNSLKGVFSAKINELVHNLTALRIYVEAAIDFPEEEIDFLSDGKVLNDLESLKQQLSAVFEEAKQGVLIREGMKVVIAGKPNAGKSSLLNALAGRDAAIVTDIAGTTRDVLKEHIHLDGMPLHIIDTAGLRDSNDVVEQMGIQRAWKEIEQSDRLLLLIDGSEAVDIESSVQSFIDENTEKSVDYSSISVIINKIDKTQQQPQSSTIKNIPLIYLSAKTGDGLSQLVEHLKAIMGYNNTSEGGFTARTRHIDALQRANDVLLHGISQLHAGSGELLAEDLRIAQQYLGEITGEVSADDLLGKIFSSFCIGK